MNNFDRSRRLWFCCMAVALLLLPDGFAWSAYGQPTSNPILRVETGMHTALIRRLVVDLPHDRLISCADDKTVRVWRLPDLRLLSTLRVPIDAGHEGQLFAIALSPDGKTVAAAGWTGWDWDHKASVYFFDIDSGELIARGGDFENAIDTLAWTRDGNHLVVGLQGRSGMRLLRYPDLTIVAKDTEYNDKATEIDVRKDGTMAVVALDGIVRIYDRSLKILGRRALAGVTKAAAGVSFSPDGKLIAIAFLDAPVITVLDAGNLSVTYRTALELPSAIRNFSTVAWSSDGKYLYAGGDSGGAGLNPIYRWGNGGRGPAETIPAAKRRITEIRPMSGGAMAFATEDPGLGVIGADGKRDSFRGPASIDFGGVNGRLNVSTDGTEIGYEVDGQRGLKQTFSVLRGGDQDLRSEPAQHLLPPLTRSKAIAVKNCGDSFSPTINGKTLRLDDYEVCRSYAISPDHHAALLGTEWALRLFDSGANELWNTRLPSVAWAVNISQGGHVAVVALSDGTIRWYRMTDGTEVLAYFPHNNGKEWISWAPSGYYVSSVLGDNLIGWHLNRGRNLTPDFFRAVQFDRVLYRPDIVSRELLAATGSRTRPGRAIDSRREVGILSLSDIAPPRVRIRVLNTTVDSRGRARAVLEVLAEKSKREMQDVSVYVNNVPATTLPERRLTGTETRRVSRRFEIALAGVDSEIRVEAFNGVSLGLAETLLSLPKSAKVSTEPGQLYVLAIGINSFPDLSEDDWLRYATNDAEEIARTIAERSGGLFKSVVTHVITDNTVVKPDHSSIVRALEFLQRARPEDTTIVFLASHGLSDSAGNYYFVPRDAKRKDILNVPGGKGSKSLLSWNVFFDSLRLTAGRRLLIVDTCHASRIEGRIEVHSLLKRSAAALFSMLVASKGEEESQEYAAGKHGLFTYALIQALAANADTNRDGFVDLEEIYASISSTVSDLHKDTIPQTPQLIVPPPLRAFPLMRLGSNVRDSL